MKMSWPNILNLILIAIIVLMFVGFFDFQKPVKISESILSFMKQNNAKAALIVGENGQVTIINEKGESAADCSIGPDGKYPQCRGLGPKGTVLSLEMFNVIWARGSTCVEVIDGNGRAKEYCW